MKEREVICARENVESFKKELKAALPGSFELIKGLHKAGMIKGLRGITLSYISTEEPETEPATVIKEKLSYCRDCAAYRPDTVGFGDGIGQCTENIKTRRTKYPMTESCNEYRAIHV